MSDHDHSPDRPYTPDEGVHKMLEVVVRSATYPQGEPIDVAVTLTDEQWNAINCAIQMILIAQFTDGNKMLPDFMIEQIHDGFHIIKEACATATGAQIVDHFIDDVLNRDGE